MLSGVASIAACDFSRITLVVTRPARKILHPKAFGSRARVHHLVNASALYPPRAVQDSSRILRWHSGINHVVHHRCVAMPAVPIRSSKSINRESYWIANSQSSVPLKLVVIFRPESLSTFGPCDVASVSIATSHGINRNESPKHPQPRHHVTLIVVNQRIVFHHVIM